MLLAGAMLLLFTAAARATSLPPELKGYDFAEAFYVEDGGVVIWPYDHGFVCPHGVPTPEGIRVMPGDHFSEFNPARMQEDVYDFLRLEADGHRAFFHERSYRYAMERDAHGHESRQRQQLLGTDDFYLTRFRALEPADHVFTDIELHPGAREWRTTKASPQL